MDTYAAVLGAKIISLADDLVTPEGKTMDERAKARTETHKVLLGHVGALVVLCGALSGAVRTLSDEVDEQRYDLLGDGDAEDPAIATAADAIASGSGVTVTRGDLEAMVRSAISPEKETKQ